MDCVVAGISCDWSQIGNRGRGDFRGGFANPGIWSLNLRVREAVRDALSAHV